MNKNLLLPNVQSFMREHLADDTAELALQKSPFQDISMREMLTQIVGLSKAENKYPEWFKNTRLYYPEKVALEQSSSEITAKYKAGLVSGRRLIDLTGGFGVDTYYFSKKIDHVIHCEQKITLSEIASANFKVLSAANIACFAEDGTEVLNRENETFDWIYIDPSRRNKNNGRVFKLAECEPSVTEKLDGYLKKSKNILIKTSPLLDISLGLSELRHVKEIHFVAVNNELKELLWLIEANYKGAVKMQTINFSGRDATRFSFYRDTAHSRKHDAPKRYLYEPNAAIMKSGGFDAVSHTFKIPSLHVNSHLFTSDNLIEFPGRRFEILKVLLYGKEAIKLIARFGKANLTTRNFPESVDMLRKRTKLKDGGENYMFFTTGPDGKKIVLICKKII